MVLRHDYNSDPRYAALPEIGSQFIGFHLVINIFRISAAVLMIVGAGLSRGLDQPLGASPELGKLASEAGIRAHAHRRLERDGV